MTFEVNLKKYVGHDIPHVNFHVTYRQGIVIPQKQKEGSDKFSTEVATNKWGDTVIFYDLMGIKLFKKYVQILAS
ncbi:MAG: hypothetical protein ACQ9CV_04870 [Nitrosopumilus sp.]|jgi:hypothetical protein